MRRAPIFLLLLPLLGLAAASPPQTWKFSAGTSPRVRIDNIAGSIQVQPSNDGQVHVEATKRGGDQADRDRLDVQVTGRPRRSRPGSAAVPAATTATTAGAGSRSTSWCGRRGPAGWSCKGVSTDVTRLGHRRRSRDQHRLGRRAGERVARAAGQDRLGRRQHRGGGGPQAQHRERRPQGQQRARRDRAAFGLGRHRVAGGLRGRLPNRGARPPRAISGWPWGRQARSSWSSSRARATTRTASAPP